jgi:F0F1-type ATP synthase membrane subunit b/b'
MMAQNDTRSLQQIKQETEQTRAGLTATVDELRTSVTEAASDIRERISPAAIKAEVSGYIRSRGEQLLDEVTAAARKNPMQAVAVGASVAYPLLRLARTIPLPVLMVGAGLFLTGSKTGKAATQKASEVASDISEEVMRRAHDLRDQLDKSASAAKSHAAEKLDRLSEAVAGGTSQASRAASNAQSTLASGSAQLQGAAKSVGDSVADAKDQGMRMAGSAADTARDAAASAIAAGQRAAAAAKDAGIETVRTVRETTSNLSDRAGKTLFETMEQNPLLVAGVGLAVGGLIASVLPRSDLEDDLIGDTSDSVKRRGQAAATQGFEAARNTVGEAYEEATRQAEAEGLDVDGFGRAARDLGQRVRRVAEAAVTTAFEPPQEEHPSGAHGDNHHG